IRRDPFDFFDKNLWTLKPDAVQRIRFQGASAFTLEAKKGAWQVVDAPVASFTADERMLKSVVIPLLQLRAQKFAAFGGEIDWAKFGLDKPATIVTITMSAAEPGKTTDHVVTIGKEAPGGGRYARIDAQKSVAELDAETVKALQRTYLDFADRQMLRFDAEA